MSFLIYNDEEEKNYKMRKLSLLVYKILSTIPQEAKRLYFKKTNIFRMSRNNM